jgi:hypothetical protein
MRIPVPRTIARLLLLAACLGLLGSCAVGTGGGQPTVASMPAARAGLRPEYRLFYDALVDYGDWALIEPYGFVFRPAVDFLSWRPYQYGFWAPTDNYGWVWMSGEPFGWATYHYGQWFYDEYLGWVWRPGLDWGPAWVVWQMSDQYVGWSPLLSGSPGAPGGIPGGAFVYTTLDRMASTDVRLHLEPEAEVGEALAALKPVVNAAERDGVRIMLGPPIARVERALGGPLARVRVDDVVPVGAAAAGPAGAGKGGDAAAGAGGMARTTRRAAEEAAREARVLSERGGRAPARLPVVRPIGAREGSSDRSSVRSGKRAGGAPADTAR